MDRSTFTDTTSQWWLNADALEYSAGEVRKDIGEDLGCSRDYEWYRDGKKLDALYTLLERTPDELWRTVDQASDDLSRAAWLKQVANSVKLGESQAGGARAEKLGDRAGEPDAAPEESVAVEKAAPAPAPAPPEKSSAFGNMISADLQPAVDDLAALVASVVAEVPGAEDLTPQDLAQLVAEVLAAQ